MQKDQNLAQLFYNIVKDQPDLIDANQLNEINYLTIYPVESIGDLGFCHVIFPLAEALLNFVFYLQYKGILLALNAA